MAQLVKNPPAMRETWLPSLSWEDPLDEGMDTHSSMLAWRIPMDRGAWRATVHGVAKSGTRLSDLAGTRAHGIVSSSHFTRDSDFSKLCFSSLTTSRNKAWAGVFAAILFSAFLS